MHGRRHRPAHGFAGVQVQHHRQVQPAAARADVGDVTHPGLIREVRIEAPCQQVVRDRQHMTAIGGVNELTPPQGSQPVLAHQTLYAVTPDVQLLSTQHRTKATAVIDLAAGGELGFQFTAVSPSFRSRQTSITLKPCLRSICMTCSLNSALNVRLCFLVIFLVQVDSTYRGVRGIKATLHKFPKSESCG